MLDQNSVLRACGGGLLALVLAWQAGARVIDDGALLSMRGGANGCTLRNCDNTNCGKHCEDNAANSCVYKDPDNPSQCGTAGRAMCNSAGVQVCKAGC
jgi:hypothetical protein